MKPASPGFSLEYLDEGVFLVLDPQAHLPDRGYVLERINAKGIRGVDGAELLSKLRQGAGRIRLAEPQTEKMIDGSVYCEVSQDQMTAWIQLIPPDPGKNAPLYRHAMDALHSEKNDVVFGIDDAAVRAEIENPTYQKIIAARGQPAMEGSPGKVTLHFEQSRVIAPKVLEDGRVDYRDLNLFASVSVGQVVATLQPTIMSENGMTVCGKPIQTTHYKEVRMPSGTNVKISEDGLTMSATRDGRVDLINGKVVVSDFYEIQQNVDLSTGNIDFAGDVIVRGNVMSGMTIIAKGNIEVYGIVEAANLQATGNIILYRGIQGMDKGQLYCEGDLVAKFIERSRVRVLGKVTADAVLHSNVDCGQGLTILGKRGALVGGIARSGEMVVARHAGAVSHTPTQVEVGINPVHRQRQLELKRAVDRLPLELGKIERLLKNVPQENAEAAKVLRMKLIASQNSLNQQLDDAQNELRELEYFLTNAQKGKVHILNKAYPGLRIAIGAQTTIVHTETDFVTFKARDGEIVFGPCEYSS